MGGGRRSDAKSTRRRVSAHIADDSLTLRRQGRGKIESDVLGSYTGTPEDGEEPEQDADDL